MRRLLVLGIAPQLAPEGVEQRHQQRGGEAEQHQRAVRRIGAGHAHPVAGAPGGGGGRERRVGLAVGDQRQRQEQGGGEQQRRPGELPGAAQRAAEGRAPIGWRLAGDRR
jgi:hypothetical protein